MTLELKPETVRLVEEETQSGQFKSADDLIARAILAMREKDAAAQGVPTASPRKRLIEVLTAAPFAGSELDLTRQKDFPRPLEL